MILKFCNSFFLFFACQKIVFTESCWVFYCNSLLVIKEPTWWITRAFTTVNLWRPWCIHSWPIPWCVKIRSLWTRCCTKTSLPRKVNSRKSRIWLINRIKCWIITMTSITTWKWILFHWVKTKIFDKIFYVYIKSKSLCIKNFLLLYKIFSDDGENILWSMA